MNEKNKRSEVIFKVRDIEILKQRHILIERKIGRRYDVCPTTIRSYTLYDGCTDHAVLLIPLKFLASG